MVDFSKLGIDVMVTVSLAAEKKWRMDTLDFSFVKDVSENDKKIILALDNIASGELAGFAMGATLIRLVNEDVKKYGDMVELLLYINIIGQEEFRHGIVMKSLVSYLTTGKAPNWKEFDAFPTAFSNLGIWTNPYEIATSLLAGEVNNSVLYECVVERLEDERLKQIFRNIESDEWRHLSAWTALTKKVTKRSPEHLLGFKKCIEDGFANVHQAEIGEGYLQGIHAIAKNNLISIPAGKKIITIKHEVYSKILGDEMPFTLIDMIKSHMIKSRNDLERAKNESALVKEAITNE